MASEKNFENRIKKFLRDNGCWFCKYFANGYTKSGVPDILACVGGKFVGIEVKAADGKPSALQIKNQELIQKAGGLSYILYPDDFEAFKLDMLNLLEQQQGNAKERISKYTTN